MKTIHETGSNNTVHSEIDCRELNELIDEINNLLKQAKSEKIRYERKNTKLKKVITNISHDLRTPLTSALGYIDMLLTSEDAAYTDELKLIQERLKRLEELVDSFFAFSKLSLQEKAPPLENINVIALLEESISCHYDDYTKDGREIHLKNSIRKYIIQSNREMLLRVFDNLIGNAFKHSNSNLVIQIDNNNKFQIIFSNKLYSSELDVEHIFDEFYTLDIARTKGGSGLGLAIAKEFMESLGHSIYAEKENNTLRIVLVFNSSAYP